MKIIIEGCDCSGKSSIAASLGTQLGLPLRERIERMKPEKAVFAHMKDLSGPSQILDRCYFISDTVYEPLMSGNNSIFDTVRNEIEEFTAEQSIIIYVYCSDEELKARYMVRGDELQSFDTIMAAHRRYREFFNNTSMPHIRLDTTNLNASQAASKIKKLIGGF